MPPRELRQFHNKGSLDDSLPDAAHDYGLGENFDLEGGARSKLDEPFLDDLSEDFDLPPATEEGTGETKPGQKSKTQPKTQPTPQTTPQPKRDPTEEDEKRERDPTEEDKNPNKQEPIYPQGLPRQKNRHPIDPETDSLPDALREGMSGLLRSSLLDGYVTRSLRAEPDELPDEGSPEWTRSEGRPLDEGFWQKARPVSEGDGQTQNPQEQAEYAQHLLHVLANSRILTNPHEGGSIGQEEVFRRLSQKLPSPKGASPISRLTGLPDD